MSALHCLLHLSSVLAADSQGRDAMSDMERLRDEIRTIAIAAGQASLEEIDPTAAQADAKFAEYCSKWAGRLDAILANAQPAPDLAALAKKALTTASFAANGWACRARTKGEGLEIARLHNEIRELRAALGQGK